MEGRRLSPEGPKKAQCQRHGAEQGHSDYDTFGAQSRALSVTAALKKDDRLDQGLQEPVHDHCIMLPTGTHCHPSPQQWMAPSGCFGLQKEVLSVGKFRISRNLPTTGRGPAPFFASLSC